MMKLLPKTIIFSALAVWCCWGCQRDVQDPPNADTKPQKASQSVAEQGIRNNYADESQPESPDALLYADFQNFWSNFFLSKIKQQQWQDLNRIIHDRYGVFAISQTTDLPTLKRFDQLEDIQQEIPEFFAVTHTFKRASLQKQQVSSARLFGPDKPRAYIVEAPGSKLLTERLEEVERRIKMSCLSVDKKAAAALEQYPLRQVVLQDAVSELLFARIEGKWYLVLWSQLMPERTS